MSVATNHSVEDYLDGPAALPQALRWNPIISTSHAESPAQLVTSFSTRSYRPPSTIHGLLREVVDVLKEVDLLVDDLAEEHRDCVDSVIVSKRRIGGTRVEQSIGVDGSRGDDDDIETLICSVEVLCNQVEGLRSNLQVETHRREEAERLLRSAKETLTAQIAHEIKKEESESERIQELTTMLERERKLRMAAEQAFESYAKDLLRDDISARGLESTQKIAETEPSSRCAHCMEQITNDTDIGLPSAQSCRVSEGLIMEKDQRKAEATQDILSSMQEKIETLNDQLLRLREVEKRAEEAEEDARESERRRGELEAELEREKGERSVDLELMEEQSEILQKVREELAALKATEKVRKGEMDEGNTADEEKSISSFGGERLESDSGWESDSARQPVNGSACDMDVDSLQEQLFLYAAHLLYTIALLDDTG